jgi:hypothetical protein
MAPHPQLIEWFLSFEGTGEDHLRGKNRYEPQHDQEVEIERKDKALSFERANAHRESKGKSHRCRARNELCVSSTDASKRKAS